MTRRSAGRPIWSWLHVSDIHLGHGDAASRSDQRLVLSDIKADIPSLIETGAPKPNAIIVTGDVAATGGDHAGEYEAASTWLADLLDQTTEHQIFCIPGNHDIKRTKAAERARYRLLRDLRSGTEPLDDCLEDLGDRKQLAARLSNYRRFQETLKPSMSIDHALAWTHSFEADGHRIRLAGINTALLCNDDDDEGRLAVGVTQLSNAWLSSTEEPDVLIVLSHHPPSWLLGSDRDTFDTYLRLRAAVLVHGHLHVPETRLVTWGNGDQLVTIAAGAAHNRMGQPHAYNISALWKDGRGRLSVRIWPRIRRDGRFVTDSENTSEHQRYANHPLKVPPRRTVPQPVRVESVERTAAAEFLRRLGSRRTAYPADMSLEEMADRNLIVPGTLKPGLASVSMTANDVAALVRDGARVLVLGPPGAGKTVMLYGAARSLLEMGVAFEIVDLRAPLDGVSPKGMIRLVDGIDEVIGGGMRAEDVAARLQDMAAGSSGILATCRQADYDRRLSAVIPMNTFSAVVTIQPWQSKGEFADFIERLAADGFVRGNEIVDRVAANSRLVSLVERPLLARMLTYLAEDGPLPESPTKLYSRYLAKLAAATDETLGRIGCPPTASIVIWRNASSYVFRTQGHRNELIQLDSLIGHLRTEGVGPDCSYRALQAIMDVGDIKGRLLVAEYVHYSFFEFLVAEDIAIQLRDAYDRDDPAAVAVALSRDLPAEIRRHLTALLRESNADLRDWPTWLAGAYEISDSDDGLRRTYRNLIAYIMCRLDVPATAVLVELLNQETDKFLENSLLWALTRGNDVDSLVRYVAQLRADPELASLNRGYLLYYFGDLRRETPTFTDDSPHVPWTNTRAQVLHKLQGSDYKASAPARQAIDIYTQLDLAAVRNERLSSIESETIRNALDRLRASLPAKVAGTLEAMYTEVS